MLQSRLICTACTKLFFCLALFLAATLPSSVDATYTTTSPPHNSEQNHQIFIPFVANTGVDIHHDSQNLVRAANNTPTTAEYVEDEFILIIDSGADLNGCLESVALIDNSIQAAALSNTSSTPTGDKIELTGSVALSSLGEEIQFYDVIEPNNSVENIVIEINAQSECEGIIAEPNYLFTLDGGSWSLGGGSWSLGGGGGSMVFADGVSEDDFYGQPAFEMLGLDWANENSYGPIIGIFDTLPAQSSSNESQPLFWSSQSWEQITGEPIEESAPCEQDSATQMVMREHGAAVSNLLKAISPGSFRYLYQVLNDCGQGNSEQLILALDTFSDTVSSFLGYVNPIIHMSLGGLPILDVSQEDVDDSGRPVALGQTLANLKNAGFIIIASSGNDSANTTAQQARWSASYDSVLGVAASNGLEGRACYSNVGDIAAPGGFSDAYVDVEGEGITIYEPVVTRDGIEPWLQAIHNVTEVEASSIDNYSNTYGCYPNMAQCEDNPEQCIITMSSTGEYMYVKGSSFAAPLVTGIIARNITSNSFNDVDRVYDCVKGGAIEIPNTDTLGAGIVSKSFECPIRGVGEVEGEQGPVPFPTDTIESRPPSRTPKQEPNRRIQSQ